MKVFRKCCKVLEENSGNVFRVIRADLVSLTSSHMLTPSVMDCMLSIWFPDRFVNGVVILGATFANTYLFSRSPDTGCTVPVSNITDDDFATMLGSPTLAVSWLDP